MLNTAIQGIVEPGWEVATTIWEHNSVLRPLNELQSRGLITLRTAATIEKAMTKQTKLVVTTHASNVTGAIQPIESIAALCQMRGALLLVDAAERPEDIDVNRALRAREEAEEELRQKRSMAEYQLAQGNLARALNRLRISGRG